MATTGSNLFKGDQTISGSIIPAVNSSYDLGSPTNEFRHLYLSSASLYIDGTKVLGSTTQELQITTDTGQSFKILEAGSDTITLQAADGNITLATSGGGDVILDPTSGVIALKGTTTLYAGNKILSSDGNAIQIGNSVTMTGSLIVTGFIETQELRTTYISSSILYRSGSTKFGDELTDTHSFTGSLSVSGSISVPDSGLVSGSSQITYSGLSGVPSGIISGSAQLPSGIVSSSIQTIANLPSGTVSGSAQTIANLPSGTVSGSVQVDVMSTTNIARLATTGSNVFTGLITAQSGITFNTTQAVGSSGTIGFNSVQGLYIYTKTGTSYDFKAYNGVGSTFMQVPTGTQNVEFLGTLSGTSATFSSTIASAGDITITKASDASFIANNTSASGKSYRLVSTNSGTFVIQNTGILDLVTIASTGAVTVATDGVFGNSRTANNGGGTVLNIMGSSGSSTSSQLNLTQVWNGVQYPIVLKNIYNPVGGAASSIFTLSTTQWNGSAAITTERFRVDGNDGSVTLTSSIDVATNGSFGFQDYRTQATQKVLVLRGEGVSGQYAPSLFNIYTKPGTTSNGIASIIIKSKYSTEAESGNLFEFKGDGSAIFSSSVTANGGATITGGNFNISVSNSATYATIQMSNNTSKDFQQFVFGSGRGDVYFGQAAANWAVQYTTAANGLMTGTYNNTSYIIGTNNTARLTFANSGGATFYTNVGVGSSNNAGALTIYATDARKLSIEADNNVRNTRLFKAYSVAEVSETWCRIRLENNYAQNYQGVWGTITVAYHPYHASRARFYQYNFIQGPYGTNNSYMKIMTVYEESIGWDYYSFASDVQFYNFENYLYIKVIGQYGGVNQIRSVTADLTGGNVAMDSVQLEVNVAAPARLGLITKNAAAALSA